MRDLNIAGRDVKTSNITNASKKQSFLSKIKWILAPLILAVLVYLIYRLTGINLSEFSH